MTIDAYAEFNDEQPGGEFLMDARTKGNWGVATGTDKDGNGLVRVFEISEGHRAGLTSKQLGLPGKLEEISGNRVDLPMPEHIDTGMLANGLLDRLHRHGATTEGQISMQATRTVMGMYGFSDNVANEAAFRNEYAKDVVPALNKAFDNNGPTAFADKPSKHAAVLDNLKRDLHVENVPDVNASDLSGSKPAAPAAKGNGFTPTTVQLGRLGQ